MPVGVVSQWYTHPLKCYVPNYRLGQYLRVSAFVDVILY